MSASLNSVFEYLENKKKCWYDKLILPMIVQKNSKNESTPTSNLIIKFVVVSRDDTISPGFQPAFLIIIFLCTLRQDAC